MKNAQAIRRTGNHARGFTLVELLVAMTVIGILAAIAYGALESVRTTARVQKTVSTIAKLDRIIMAKYNSYRTRRVQIIWPSTWNADKIALLKNREVALVRLSLLRDLMRWEMPDRWSDVNPSRAPKPQTNPCLLSQDQIPSLAQRYYTNYNNGSGTTQYEQAECLYQIVAAIPEALSQFRDDEIGDYDGDGLREFRDAWGNPILFYRWPAGYLPPVADTALQTNEWNVDSSGRKTLKQPDPFDPMKAGGDNYALYPLIVSSGPNGMPGIYAGGNNPVSNGTVGGTQFQCIDPYKPSPPVGQPDLSQSGHYDNITNHRLPTP